MVASKTSACTAEFSPHLKWLHFLHQRKLYLLAAVPPVPLVSTLLWDLHLVQYVPLVSTLLLLVPRLVPPVLLVVSRRHLVHFFATAVFLAIHLPQVPHLANNV
jgi:hypothetical protein